MSEVESGASADSASDLGRQFEAELQAGSDPSVDEFLLRAGVDPRLAPPDVLHELRALAAEYRFLALAAGEGVTAGPAKPTLPAPDHDGRTVLLVTHNPRDACFADEVRFLVDGQIAQDQVLRGRGTKVERVHEALSALRI